MLDNNFPSWPFFSVEEGDIAKNVLMSNRVNYWTGNECKKFESEFADYCNAKYAVALANGTIALDAALKALKIGHGDEVLVTSRTFLASVSSIVNSGATPIFIDVSQNSQNIDCTKIKEKITHKTKAIICVHLSGWPCDMDEIIDIAKEHSLYVIEDCAQAHGAVYKGKPVGSIGDIGCWSFCQDKIMTTAGEGGMITTNSRKLWKIIWELKDHGKSYDEVHNLNPSPGFRWLHHSFGNNWRMTEIQAAIGRHQITKMPEWNKIRNEYQNIILDTCRSINGLRVPDFSCRGCDDCPASKKCIHAAYKTYVFVQEDKLKHGWSRDKILDEINDMGVPCFSGSCSEVYLEKAFIGTNFIPTNRLRVAKKLGETSLMFLVHPSLSKKNIDHTCKAIMRVMKKASNN